MRQENDLISILAAGSIAPPSWPPRRGSSWWGWRSHVCGGSPRYLARRGTGPHTGRAVLHLSWFGLHYLRHALYCNYAITFPFVIFKFFLDNPNVYSNHNFHSIVKQIFCISQVVKKILNLNMILSENLFSFTKFIKLSKYTKPLKNILKLALQHMWTYFVHSGILCLIIGLWHVPADISRFCQRSLRVHKIHKTSKE